MRCTVCSGPLLFDRLENESRCLICGRAAKAPSAKRPPPPERKRQEYPRRFKTHRDDKQAECWG